MAVPLHMAKTRKHVLNGATMVPLVMSTFGKLGPAAEGYLTNLASVACSTGVVDRGRGIFFATTTVVLQRALGRILVMMRLCHSNDFGSLWLCSQFAIRVLALRFAFQLVTRPLHTVTCPHISTYKHRHACYRTRHTHLFTQCVNNCNTCSHKCVTHTRISPMDSLHYCADWASASAS
jgi:hypothetical protein